MILGFKTQYSDLENIIQTAWNFYKNKNERSNPKI
jgi:UDP-glucose 4-epimerase